MLKRIYLVNQCFCEYVGGEAILNRGREGLVKFGISPIIVSCKCRTNPLNTTYTKIFGIVVASLICGMTSLVFKLCTTCCIYLYRNFKSCNNFQSI